MKQFVLAMALGLGVGCAGGFSRVEGDLQGAASRELQCPRDDMEMYDLKADQERLVKLAGGPTQAYVRGCGRRLAFARMCHADGSGCDWYSVKKLRLEPLLSRASFDAKCSKDGIVTTQIAPNTIGVEACGHRLTYLWNCPHNQDLFSPACSWVLNNESRPVASPTP